MREADKEIAHLSSLDKECPTCQQEVNQALITNLKSQSQKRSQEAEEAIRSLELRIYSIKELNSRITEKKAKQKEFEDLLSKYNPNISTQLLDADKISRDIEETTKKIDTLKAEIDKIHSENEKRRVHNTKISIFLEQSEKLKADLSTASDSLFIEEKKLSNLDILKRAFSTNGLLAYKLENLVKELEDLTNTYLSELSDGRFGLSFVVEKDKLNVSLSDNGNAVDILALSSGELARVNTATLLSIRKLMSSISKSRLNVLFLDEVINVIDELGREKLVEVLLSEEELNTYMVSHGWTHPLLDKIEVIKHKNISRLEK